MAHVRGTMAAALSGSSNGRRKKKKKRRLGEYQIVRVLGAGATGEVFLGRRDGQDYAIKSIAKSELKAKDLRRVAREILIMQQLDHPNIVSLVEVLESNSKLHLVLEFCPGGEVLEYIEAQGPMSEGFAKLVIRQVASALQYCHVNRVAHRDVKLQNILMSEDHTGVKLSDFGMSSMDVSPKALLATACGTPYYVAPEVTSGVGYKGYPADVWSLGVCLYALIMGRFPFEGGTVRGVLQAARKGVFKMPPNASAPLRTLLRGVLNVNESERWTIDDVLGSEWMTGLVRPAVPPRSSSPSSVLTPEITDDTDLDDDWVWLETTASGGVAQVDIGAARGAGVSVRSPHAAATGAAGASAAGASAAGASASRPRSVPLSVQVPGDSDSQHTMLSISSDSSVVWTPAGSDAGVTFASHANTPTMLFSTDGAPAAIVHPDETLTDQELFASISSCWTSDSGSESDSSSGSGLGGGGSSFGSIGDSDLPSLSDDSDLGPVPEPSPSAGDLATRLSSLPTDAPA